MRARLTGKLVVGALVLMVVGGASAEGARLITGANIKNSSITGKDVRNGSIAASDLSKGVRSRLGSSTSASSSTPVPGPQGPAGPAGPAGAQGPAGPSNVAGMTRVFGSTSLPPGQIGSAVAACPSGQRAVSSSWFTGIARAGSAGVTDERTAAYVIAENASSITVDIDATGFCVPSGAAVAASSQRARAVAWVGRRVSQLREARSAAR